MSGSPSTNARRGERWGIVEGRVEGEGGRAREVVVLSCSCTKEWLPLHHYSLFINKAEERDGNHPSLRLKAFDYLLPY
jgi:hypothetical protein